MSFRSTAAAVIASLVILLAAVATTTAVTYAQDDEPRIFHTIRMTPRDDADPAKVEEVLAKVRHLGSTSEDVEDFIVGADMSGEYEISITYILEGYDGYHAYLFDPLHIEIDKMALPLAKSMELLDVVETDDPAAAAARLAAMQQERFEKVEGLLEMFQQIGK
ncbi:Dabb family protein (plasmid) [Devosia sp. A8/3-2]|nr:Dabb family protein [Devosia sp. A8/3-2]